MQCPKCGAENTGARNSCWSCMSSLNASESKAGKVVVGTPKPSGTSSKEVSKERRLESRSREKSGSGINFPAIISIVALIGIAAAWWFLLANPKPETTAQLFIDALNSAMSGDVQPMKAIVSSNSQDKLSSLESLSRTGGSIKVTLDKISKCTVSGQKADLTIDTGVSIGGNKLPVNVPMNISMVKEGSFVMPKWKVDVATSAPGLPTMKQ